MLILAKDPGLYPILITFDPSAAPARLFADTNPFFPLLQTNLSHQSNRKSRAISLNQGVKEFAAKRALVDETS